MSLYRLYVYFTYIVVYPENEKYLKYFPMYLYLNTFAFKIFVIVFESKSICIYIHLSVFDPMFEYYNVEPSVCLYDILPLLLHCYVIFILL